MSKQSPILGKKIRAMTDGGWELTGVVTHDKTDRVILLSENGETLLLFKKKISAILIVNLDLQNRETREEQNVGSSTVSSDNFVLFKPSREKPKKEEKKEQTDDLSEGGVSLPHEVLMSVPEKHKFRGGDDDFSISMTSLFGNNAGRISVTVDDESK